MRFNQFNENSALEKTEKIIAKTFSPERRKIDDIVAKLVRQAAMGVGDKQALAKLITDITKSELQAKAADPDLAIAVDQNLGMLKRAMAKVTGVEEDIGKDVGDYIKKLLTPGAVTKAKELNKGKKGPSLANKLGMKGYQQQPQEDTDIPFNECPQCRGPIFTEGEGKKDACYHKVKSRYKVWPSAYASGALVQCRKVGAANWGNKSKK